jgi:hypothetical protein
MLDDGTISVYAVCSREISQGLNIPFESSFNAVQLLYGCKGREHCRSLTKVDLRSKLKQRAFGGQWKLIKKVLLYCSDILVSPRLSSVCLVNVILKDNLV